MKSIYLLIGPKGGGKTYIGSLVMQRLGIRFLEVEKIALGVRREREHDDSEYIREVFAAIEAGVRRELESVEELVFESTGLTDQFREMLNRLRADFQVHLIRVEAEPAQCERRVLSRDASRHVPVAVDDIRRINAMILENKLEFHAVIGNQDAMDDDIIAAFRALRKLLLYFFTFIPMLATIFVY